MGGHLWLELAKLMNIFLVCAGIVFITKCTQSQLIDFIIILGIVSSVRAEWTYSSQMYETGVMFLYVCAVVWTLEKRKTRLSLLLAGIAYLVRPELLLFGIVTVALSVYRSKGYWSGLGLAVLSFIPMALYHLYMQVYSGDWIPSSIVARLYTSLEDPSWLNRFGTSLRGSSPLGVAVFLVFVVISILSVFLRRFHGIRPMAFLGFPLVFLYALLPPRDDVLRYLLPSLPICVLAIYKAISALNLRWAAVPITLGISLWFLWSNHARNDPAKYETMQLLGNDLSTALDSIAKKEDLVLVYEIQFQYSLACR